MSTAVFTQGFAAASDTAVPVVSVGQDIAALRANLHTQSAVAAQLANATAAEREQLLTEENLLVRANIALLNALATVDSGAGVGSSSSPSGLTGNPTSPQGTPAPPPSGTPFPFPGGTMTGP
ncbi:MAG: hypothetical protein ACYCXG_12270 [Acidiferrobacter sp.]